MEDTNKKNNTSKKSMKYYNFYTKIYLLICIILNSFTVASNIQNIQEWNILSIITMTINIIFYVILQIKLREELILKTQLGYRLVLVFFIFDIVYKTFISTVNVYLVDPTEILGMYAIMFFLIYSIWTIPNLIYFVKRKDVFTNEKNNKVKNEVIVQNNKENMESVDIVENDVGTVAQLGDNEVEDKEIKSDKIDVGESKKRIEDSKCWKIISFALVIFIIMLVCVLVITITRFNKEIDNLYNIIAQLEEEKNAQLAEHNEDMKAYWNYASKASFFDKYAVIVPGNTEVYHKYDCTYCDKSSFKIFNIENARRQGYKACSHCIK